MAGASALVTIAISKLLTPHSLLRTGLAAAAPAAAAAAHRVAGIGRGDETVRRPEGKGHDLQHEGQEARGVLWVFFGKGFHVRIAVERSTKKAVKVAVHLCTSSSLGVRQTIGFWPRARPRART